MTTESFQNPQRQSITGIVLIFFRVAYKFIKGFWAVLIVIFVSSPGEQFSLYAKIGIGILVIVGIIYSYQYYRRFLFHIDYDRDEFVLEKGVFSTHTLNIPFDKIQQVDLKRSILQRIIGVYSLSIDTAGSKGKELQIRAMTEEKARELSEILIQVMDENNGKQEAKESTDEKPEATAVEDFKTPPEKWTYKLSLAALFKIGITRGYLRGFLLIIAFVFSIYSQINQTAYFDSAKDYSESLFGPSLQNLGFIIFFGIAILILSVIVTVAEVIIKHFGLKLQQTAQSLELEMGLKTNTKILLRPRRLQRLEISTNPIQKRLDLYEAQFSLASSEDKLNKTKIIIPGLDMGTVEKIKSFLYGTASHSEPKQFKPGKRWLVRKFCIAIGLLSIFWIVDFFLFQLSNWGWAVGISIIFLLCVGIFFWGVLKTISLEISQDFLLKRHGLWRQKVDTVELYKLEGISVKQPFYYRKSNMYNLTFHTAGGDIAIRAMGDRALREMNYILYKIEIAQRAWM